MAALMWWITSALPTLTFIIPGKNLLAIGLLSAGGIIAAAGVVACRRAKTTVNPLKPEKASSLIIAGPYYYTRNPMYVGMLFVLVGWAVYLSNLAALLFTPAFILYMNRFQIEPEERALTARFPREYPAYRGKVRRWI